MHAAMQARESVRLGLTGVTLVWQSGVAAACALVVGLAVGVLAVGRARRRPGTADSTSAAGRERELESLRRIAAELAQASDVEGVVRALLDEIGSLFDVRFASLSFVSPDVSRRSR